MRVPKPRILGPRQLYGVSRQEVSGIIKLGGSGANHWARASELN